MTKPFLHNIEETRKKGAPFPMPKGTVHYTELKRICCHHCRSFIYDSNIEEEVKEAKIIGDIINIHKGVCAEGYPQGTNAEKCKDFFPGCNAYLTDDFLNKFYEKFCSNCDIDNIVDDIGLPFCLHIPNEGECLNHSIHAKELLAKTKGAKTK